MTMRFHGSAETYGWRLCAGVGCVVFVLALASSLAAQPLPTVTVPASPVVSATPLGVVTPTLAIRTATPGPSPVLTTTPEPMRPVPSPTAPPSPAFPEAVDAGTVDGGLMGLPTAVLPQPRVFRTPIRNVPPAFVPPAAPIEPEAPADGDPAPAAQAPPPATRGGTATVTFRAVARTVIEGFALLVTYSTAAGEFVGSADQVACSASASATFVANDHDDGSMNLILASAQALPFPIAITCRFAIAPGGAVGPGSFAVHVAEVSSDARAADPSLLTVSVDVR